MSRVIESHNEDMDTEEGPCDIYDDAFLEAFDEGDLESLESSDELPRDVAGNKPPSRETSESFPDECLGEESAIGSGTPPDYWEQSLISFTWSPQLKEGIAPFVTKIPLNMKSREGDEAIRRLNDATDADLSRFALSILNNSSLEETENKLGAYFAFLEKDRRQGQIGHPTKKIEQRTKVAPKKPHLQNLKVKTNAASWVHRQPWVEEPLGDFYGASAQASACSAADAEQDEFTDLGREFREKSDEETLRREQEERERVSEERRQAKRRKKEAAAHAVKKEKDKI